MANEASSMVPEIRFRGFTGRWILKSIQELVDDGVICPPQDGNHGEIHPKTTDYVVRGIPFIMANNIRGGEIELYDCSHITIEQADSLRKGFARAGDVLLTHKGTVGETAIVCDSEFPYIMLTPQVTYYRITDRERLDNNFLAFSFASEEFQHAVKEISGGGTRAYVGITLQKRLSITIPPERPEQTKIGGYFRELDRLIRLQQRKYDKLVTLKKAMLQKMFPQPGTTTPEIRFKGFGGEWAEKRLLEHIPRIVDLRGRTPKKLGLDWSPSGHLALSALNVKNGYIDFSIPAHFGDTKLYHAWMKGSELHKNQVLFTTEAPMGNVAQIADDRKYILSQRVIAFEVDTSFLSEDFLAVLLRSPIVVEKLIALSSGATAKGVSQKSLSSFKSFFPVDVTEQQKIGTYFRTLDRLISKYAVQLEKLKQIKSACLEKMFV